MSRITRGQLAAMLLITDVFALFCLMGGISLTTAAGFGAAALIQLVMAIPAARFYSSGGTLKNSGKAAELFYLVYIILWGGVLLVMLWSGSEIIRIPYDNFGFVPERLLITGLIAVICLYASSPGLRSLSRASFIAAALGVVCIGIVAVSSLFDARWQNFTETSGSAGFWEELLRGFVLGGGSGSLVVLLGFSKDSTSGSIISYFVLKLILTAAVTISAVLTVGGISEITAFPIITAAQLAQPFSSQRIDSLFLMIFVVFAVFAVSVQAVCASYLLERVFPSVKRFKSTIVLLLMCGAACMLSGIDVYNPVYAALSVTALLIVPSVMLIKKSKGGG